MHLTHESKGYTMRKVTALSLLAAITLTGCGKSPTSGTAQPATPIQASQTSAPASKPPKTVQSKPAETLPPEPTETFHFRTIDPKDEERADEDIMLICGIVTREVHTHEFPQLWLEGSRESKLADEYEKLLPGAQAHEALMQDCPAYADLHSKNVG